MTNIQPFYSYLLQQNATSFRKKYFSRESHPILPSDSEHSSHNNVMCGLQKQILFPSMVLV
jgi:hypothetical protein